MDRLKNLKIGIAMCGSFCTYEKVFSQIENIIDEGAEVFPIMSFNSSNMDTRFGKADEFLNRFEKLTKKNIINTIQMAERIGPENMLDILAISPCTGNTAAKLANGITDTPVLMACKSHLRNRKPLVIAISTNDGLGITLKNIGFLINVKNIYFVPFEQDNFENKPNSIVAKMDLLIPTIEKAIVGQQLQPII